MYGLLWLLLPIAAISGWWAARWGSRDKVRRDPRDALRSDYYRGVRYLLNEQPDKAIEVFIRLLEVDSDTVETHLALGNLYRRSGEVDRAIRLHQNLIERSTLSVEQRSVALLELGQDHMRAGLLDRAEDLFEQLVASGDRTVPALRQLVDIYEQEKDWDKAIGAARRLEQTTGESLGAVIAHYYCEQAELEREKMRFEEARDFVRRAFDTDPDCVRASLIEGELHVTQGDYIPAVTAFRRVEMQDSDYIPETVSRVQECLQALGESAEVEGYLADLVDNDGLTTAVLALAERKRRQCDDTAAREFLVDRLRQRPSLRCLDRLLELRLSAPDPELEHLAVLRQTTAALLAREPKYKCGHCGFAAKTLHWQCPGCRKWNTVKPVRGLEGE